MKNSYERYEQNMTEFSAMEYSEVDEVDELDYLIDGDHVEVIVKFSGDISEISRQLQAEVEVLLQGYAIITIDKQKIPKLYSYPQIESLELPKNVYITSQYNLISSCIRSVQDSKQLNLTGRGVIVGVIDSGIDYTHMDFRNEDGSSRILYIWDQTQAGSPPLGFTAGAEYTQEQINDALNSQNPLEIVPSTDTNGHGTAVAGIAAGNGAESNGENAGVAPNAELIIVKVGTKGYNSFARTTELMRAIKYVIDKARQLNKPIAINMSYGMNNGSHEGDSLFETYLSDISTEWKSSIVIPTGNEGAAGHHYADKITPYSIKEVEFFSADGLDKFYISIWKNFVDNITVELICPGSGTTGIIGIESQIKSVRLDNVMITVIYGQPSHYSVSQEIYFDLTAITGTIAAGLWKLRIISTNVVDGNIQIWLPTTEAVTLKTQFTKPNMYNTMTIPSTAQKVIKVAGYNDRVGNIAEFSGIGNLNDMLPNPDLAAPAVGIITTRRGGGYDSYTGTSMAAPFVTGSAALIMQWGIVNKNDPFLYGERIKAFLRLGAGRSAIVSYPNPAFGYGTLCLSNTMSYLERYKWGGDNRWIQT